MSRMKLVFAVLVLTAMVTLVPPAHASAVVKVIASGSSAMWQSMALGAWNNGNCPSGGVAPCDHYTGSSNFNLVDSRPSTGAVTDSGGTWIVWDHANKTTGTHNVWAYIKVDSVVGDRCFFATPSCTIEAPGGVLPSAGNKISSAIWGSDATPPSDVAGLFTASSGVSVNAAGTDIRPEDGAFAQCRVNSKSGKNLFDATDGLGYNSVNASGICPAFGDSTASLVGTAIQSGVNSSTSDVAHVLAFSLSGGKDPFTGNTVPASFTTSVGAQAIVFFYGNAGGQLASLSNVTEAQLQSVFTGASCDASALGLSSAGIQSYQREPLSGTMNTTEANVFRRPVSNPPPTVYGTSQETGVNGTNPLTGTSVACPSSNGKGGRWRVIGTGEMVSSVQNSDSSTKNTWGNQTDGIGYAFFGFGNFSAIFGSSAYGYVSISGVDPIFTTHPSNNELPSCTYPCSETSIWGAVGTSFPNVRNGSYSAWSVVRMVANTASRSNVQNLVKASQKFVVDDVPDYVPFVAATGSTGTDPGLTILRSHYQQWDGAGNALGPAPSNSKSADKGGDMGGCILASSKDFGKVSYIQTAFGETYEAKNCVKR